MKVEYLSSLNLDQIYIETITLRVALYVICYDSPISHYNP